MKSSELCKICHKLIFPNKFRKKGRLAYYTLSHKTGAMVLVGLSVSLPTNAPMPYIVHNNTVYYPYEYNLLVFGFKNKTKFRTIKMK